VYPRLVLVRLVEHFTYAAVFGLLVAGGMGVPVPEELVQLTAGYLARRGVVAFLPAAAAAWLGLVLGDALLFGLARSRGPGLLASPRLARLLPPSRRAAIERHFARHAFLTVVAGRHLSVLRLPIFALAGASGVPTRTFVLADALSALVSVPLVLGLGWLFAGSIEDLRRDLRWLEHALALLAAGGFAAWALWQRRRPPAQRD
jgi:membrane protein DedA with SNARE-associated domain